jgi:hypothetical protein
VNAKAKVGAPWESIEGVLEEKVQFYMDGLFEGLDSDD